MGWRGHHEVDVDGLFVDRGRVSHNVRRQRAHNELVITNHYEQTTVAGTLSRNHCIQSWYNQQTMPELNEGHWGNLDNVVRGEVHHFR